MTTQTVPNLLTVRQFAQRHPAFTEGSLRWLIFQSGGSAEDAAKSPQPGLDQALVRLGRRVLINEGAFFQWLERRGRS